MGNQVSLELHQIPEAEVRRGWMRIHEKRRGGIQAGELVKIKGISGSVLRVVYGLPEGYQVGGRRSPGEDWICMDEPTRDALGLQDYPVGSVVTVTLCRTPSPMKISRWLCYSLQHPKIPLRVGAWLALVSFLLGLISIGLGILSVVKA